MLLGFLLATVGFSSIAQGAEPPASPLEPCSNPLHFSSELRLAPAAEGQPFQRCGTLGDQGEWRVTVSPDGRRLAALTASGTVRLIATDGWREIAQLASALGQFDAVAFSPDSTRLATLSNEMGQVSTWRTSDGVLERTFAGPPASTIDGWAAALAFSSDGRRLATSLLTLIDLSTGRSTDWLTGKASTAALTIHPQNLDTGGAIATLRFTDDNRHLFVDARGQVGHSPPSQQLSVWNPQRGTEVVLFSHYDRALQGAAVSPDGRVIAIGATEEAGLPGSAGLALFSAKTGALVGRGRFAGQVLAFSPDGARLYVGVESGAVALNSKTFKVVAKVDWPKDSKFLGLSPGGDVVTSVSATAVTPAETAWWRFGEKKPVRTIPYELTAISWSADGALEVGTSSRALFHAWRGQDGEELCAPPASPGSAANLLAVSSDGLTLAVGRVDGRVEVHDLKTSQAAPAPRSFDSGLGPMERVAVSNGGGRVAGVASAASSKGEDVTLAVFDASRGTRLFSTPTRLYGGRFALSPDGRSLAFESAGGDPDASLLHSVAVDTGAVQLSLTGSDVRSSPDTFSPDGARLAVRSPDGLAIWRLSDRTLEATVAGAIGWGFAGMLPDWSAVATHDASIDHPAGVKLTPFASSSTRHRALPAGVSRGWPLRFAPDGSVVAVPINLIHTHGVDYRATEIRHVATGDLLRVFGATADTPPLAIEAAGRRIYTLVGGQVAVWCR